MLKQRIGVIGAGAAGLCAGRNLISNPQDFDFSIFEQSSEVGGTWNYTDKVGVDEDNLPIHSSMYRNLRTNVPKEIMGYPDFPFPDSGSSFTHHTNVLLYLKNYAKEFGFYDKIMFRRHVKSLTPEPTAAGKNVWKIIVTNLDTRTDEEYEFDAVMVCNGHYAVPHIPMIEGIGEFLGQQSHSHGYRDPERFKGKTVVVLGAASSGIDIAVEVAQHAAKIYLSHNLPTCISSKLPANVRQVPGIKRAHSEGFTFLDDTSAQADELLYCTGYQFSFPFLADKCNVAVDGNRVRPLYKHLIHMDYKELCFVGLPFTVLPFPMFHFQIQYFLKTLTGAITLPSREEMEEETNVDFHKRIIDMRMPAKHAHKMGTLQWDYYKELCNETLPPVCKMIYDKVEKERKNNVMFYKREDYKLLSCEEYVRMMPEP